MLETTLKTEFVPGTNLKGDMVTADWRFLLPNLEIKKVAWLGIPPISTVSVFSRMGAEVFLIESDLRKLSTAKRRCADRSLKNVITFNMNGKFAVPISGASIDLAVINGRNHLRKVMNSESLLEQLCDLVKPEGVLFFVIDHPLDQFLYNGALANLAARGFSRRQVFRLAPPFGRMRAAVAIDDRETSRFFIRNMVYSNSPKNKVLKMIGAAYGSFPRAIVARRHWKEDRLQHPPEYLSELARENGFSLKKYKWGLSAGGRHNSKKILFFLFNRETARPEVIVKLTRSPEFNYRLENEYRILSQLQEGSLLDHETVPRPLFFGYHNDLVILGQQVIRGRTFRRLTHRTPDCPYVQKAIQWITDFGVNSADSAVISAVEVREKLQVLFEKFRGIYRLSPEHETFLRGQLDAFAGSAAPFPSVFQHGDPGAWNMLVMDDERLALIDWEAGEPQGLPLWDLFYFLKTYGPTLAEKSAKGKDSVQIFREQFLSKSALGSVLINATQTYCERIKLDTRLVEPLFYTCWMHRALKESTRLPLNKLESGRYVSLLRAVIDHRNSETLVKLFRE